LLLAALEQMIVATALPSPQVLLFDEPVNGLDPEGILWVRDGNRGRAAPAEDVRSPDPAGLRSQRKESP
ncbi:hypothetical protein ABZ462_36100, partial [Streptomyces albogriseolus]